MNQYTYDDWECGKGWTHLIAPIIDQINLWNNTASDEEQIEIFQIKEKWGALEVYLHNVPEKLSNTLDDMISNARLESMQTCEVCGTKDEVGTTLKGWIFPICKSCLKTSINNHVPARFWSYNGKIYKVTAAGIEENINN